MDAATPTPPLGRLWRPRLLAASYVAAGLLYLTWAVPPGNALWEAIDARGFAALNSTLADGGGWAETWAWLNTRIADVTWAALMGGVCIAYAVFGRARPWMERLAISGVVTVGVLLAILIAKKVFPAAPRLGPGFVAEPFVNLAAMFPELDPKVASRHSFPGDHGVASVAFFTGVVTLMGVRWAVPGAIIALLNVLPRLMGGGHWISDVVVGGITIGFIVAPLMFAAPSVHWVESMLRRVIPVGRVD